MIWFCLVLIIAHLIGWFVWYMTRIIKKTVVYPVKGKMLGDGLLSEKPRWKVIKEEHGLSMGCVFGFLLMAICMVIGMYGGS